jgi:cytochrome c peroxidase
VKKIFFVLVLLAVLIGLQNCKRDPLITKNTYTDADSLYTGKKYVINVPFRFPTLSNPYADSMTYEGVELGRRLFYDKHLSLDGQKSCGSCHHVQYALSDSGFSVSTNEFGLTKRNAPPIQNLAWATKQFWDGRVNTLAEQAQDAYQHELGIVLASSINYLKGDSVYTRLFRKAFGRPGDITDDKIYKAVQQFMMSAVSANSKFDKYVRGEGTLTSSELAGYRIFGSETGDCFHCHMSGGGSTYLMTDNLFSNNGLDSASNINDFRDPGRGGITLDPADYGRFKDPSLRNVALTAPYMHDGRYKTLDQVINFYSDSMKMSPTINSVMLLPNHANGGLHLSQQQKVNLLDFLNTLTDTSFLHNPALADPF